MNIKSWFQKPDPPVIPRETYAPPLSCADTGENILSLMPAAGQNAVPQPQTLYDVAKYPTPFGVLWKRPRNTLTG